MDNSFSKKLKNTITRAACHDQEVEFLQWVRDNPKDGWTYVESIASWLDSGKRFKMVRDFKDLESAMQTDDYFEPRHYRKVESTLQYWLKYHK